MSLNELNFKTLIDYSLTRVDDYTFDDYKKNGYHHPKATGYCTRCEEAGFEVNENRDYMLCNISHGSHSADFLRSGGITDTEGWHDAGVMFVMEGPSKDDGFYEQTDITKNGHTYHKHPTKEWYWIHTEQKITGFPDKFTSREYGPFVASAILTFRLSNAYMTNLIKCGLNNPRDNKYLGIKEYNPACVRMCYDEFLSKEIEFIQPKVIFAFGSSVYDHLKNFIGKNIKVVCLPHPSARCIQNEYFKTLYFCTIAKSLLNADIISCDFYCELMQKFAESDNRASAVKPEKKQPCKTQLSEPESSETQLIDNKKGENIMPDFNFSEPVNFELLSFADRYGAYLSQKETAPADETEKKLFKELLRICKKETAKVIFRKFDEYFDADEWDDNRQSGKKYSYFQFYLRDRSGWGRNHAVHFELKEIKRETHGLFLPAGYSIHFHVEDQERRTFTEDKINALENKKIQFSEYLRNKYDDGTSFSIDYSSEEAFEHSVDILVGEIFRDAVLKYYKEIDAIING